MTHIDMETDYVRKKQFRSSEQPTLMNIMMQTLIRLTPRRIYADTHGESNGYRSSWKKSTGDAVTALRVDQVRHLNGRPHGLDSRKCIPRRSASEREVYNSSDDPAGYRYRHQLTRLTPTNGDVPDHDNDLLRSRR